MTLDKSFVRGIVLQRSYYLQKFASKYECLTNSLIPKFSCRSFEFFFFRFPLAFLRAILAIFSPPKKKKRKECAERELEHFQGFAASGGHRRHLIN